MPLTAMESRFDVEQQVSEFLHNTGSMMGNRFGQPCS